MGKSERCLLARVFLIRTKKERPDRAPAEPIFVLLHIGIVVSIKCADTFFYFTRVIIAGQKVARYYCEIMHTNKCTFHFVIAVFIAFNWVFICCFIFILMAFCAFFICILHWWKLFSNQFSFWLAKWKIAFAFTVQQHRSVCVHIERRQLGRCSGWVLTNEKICHDCKSSCSSSCALSLSHLPCVLVFNFLYRFLCLFVLPQIFTKFI